MMVVAERFEDLQAAALATNWRGRSGRFYALEPLPLERFALTGDHLYLLTTGERVLWVGTADEVIAEALTRARFRVALGAADAAFRMDAPLGEIERMTIAWDLEGAEPVLGLRLT